MPVVTRSAARAHQENTMGDRRAARTGEAADSSTTTGREQGTASLKKKKVGEEEVKGHLQLNQLPRQKQEGQEGQEGLEGLEGQQKREEEEEAGKEMKFDMQSVVETLEDTKSFAWRKRMDALRWLREQSSTEEGQRKICEKGSMTAVRSGDESGDNTTVDNTLMVLAGVLETQLRDLRSAVVSGACETVVSLSKHLADRFAPAAPALARTLLELSGVGNSVIKNRAHNCVIALFSGTQAAPAIDVVLGILSSSRHADVLYSGFLALTTILKAWRLEVWRPSAAAISRAISIGANEASPMVRSGAIAAFRSLQLNSPEDASQLLKRVEIRTRDILLQPATGDESNMHSASTMRERRAASFSRRGSRRGSSSQSTSGGGDGKFANRQKAASKRHGSKRQDKPWLRKRAPRKAMSCSSPAIIIASSSRRKFPAPSSSDQSETVPRSHSPLSTMSSSLMRALPTSSPPLPSTLFPSPPQAPSQPPLPSGDKYGKQPEPMPLSPRQNRQSTYTKSATIVKSKSCISRPSTIAAQGVAMRPDSKESISLSVSIPSEDNADGISQAGSPRLREVPRIPSSPGNGDSVVRQWVKCKGSPGSAPNGSTQAVMLSPRISALAEEEDYYYFRNTQTGEISWSPWVQTRDQKTGACSYVNVETGDRTYRRPAGALMPSLKRALSEEARVLLEAL